MTTQIQIIDRWKTFINSQGHCALPAGSIHVALYLTHLLENGSSQHPVNSAIYGIKWAHDIVGLPDPTKNTFVSSLQEVARRNAYRPVHKKEPISKEMIIELCNKYEECNDILIVRNMLMILLDLQVFYDLMIWGCQNLDKLRQINTGKATRF